MEKDSQPIDFYLLIPYYNDEAGLLTSLNSVEYDPEKFAILIIDDGSDRQPDSNFLVQNTSRDFHIEVRSLPVNRGITAALNEGLGLLREREGYKYIARLDCGDICSKDRFKKQVDYLDAHPGTGLLGSWCEFRDPVSGDAYLYRTPVVPGGILWGMNFRNIFIHPTVMFRADAMKRHLYPDEFPYAEDYGLFYNLMLDAGYAILPENLVACKINKAGLSLHNRKAQLKSRMNVVRQFGKSRIGIAFGVLKVQLLLIIPYRPIWHMKVMLYRPGH